MMVRKLVVTLAAGTAAALIAVPALAQQVLVCFTLHNDLANFDRRAHRPEFAVERAAAERAAADYAWQCTDGRPAWPFADCAALAAQADARQAEYIERLRGWALSPIGGSDPVRLALIDQMYRNGCPLPPEIDLLRQPIPVMAPPPRPDGHTKPPLRVLGKNEPRKTAKPAG